MNRRVLLLSMPYGALDRPALGLSLLKAELTRARIRCDVRYFTFTMAEFLGDDYRRIGSTLPYTAFAGDWTFTGDLYGRDPGRDSRYVEEVLKGAWRLGADDVERVLAARSLAPAFLDYCMEAVDWGRYGLVGFTSTF